MPDYRRLAKPRSQRQHSFLIDQKSIEKHGLSTTSRILMQAVLPSCSDIVAMHVAGTFGHSPTSSAQELPFVFTDPRHAGFESPGLIVPGHIPDITPRLDSTGPVRRRRTSKSLSNSALKRSASTPNVRSSQQSDIPGNMLNDKKRNKLGYHRTSVACGMLGFLCLGFLLTRISSTLSKTKDTLPARTRRSTESMCQLHSAEKGVSLLPGRTTTTEW